MKRLTTLMMLLIARATGMQAATYRLWVAETQVTDDNMGDVLGDGTVSYDPATNTLTLDRAMINGSGNEAYGICNYTESGPVPGDIEVNKLTIYVKSDSQVNTDDQCLYFRGADITITGPGTLSMYSEYQESICALICSLTFSDANIAARGRYSAINGRGSVMTIDHSMLKAWPMFSGRMPTIYDFNAVEMKDCYFSDLEYDNCMWYGHNFYYNDGTCEMYYQGDYDDLQTGEVIYWDAPYCSWVTILPTKMPIEVFVGGVQVTAENADDLTKAINDQGAPNFSASGTIRYDWEANALTLEDATIQIVSNISPALGNGQWVPFFGFDFITGGIPGLRIDVYGNCLIENTYGQTPALVISSPTTLDVHDGGKLSVKGTKYGLLINSELDIVEGNISIENRENPGRGIEGFSPNALSLFEKEGTLTVNGGIYGIATLNLTNGTQIVSPAGGYFNPEKGGIYYGDDTPALNDIVFSNVTTPTAIDKATTASPRKPSPIYDLQGRMVYRGYEGTEVRGYENSNEVHDGNLTPSHPHTPAPSMKKGIYIINGKKYIYY